MARYSTASLPQRPLAGVKLDHPNRSLPGTTRSLHRPLQLFASRRTRSRSTEHCVNALNSSSYSSRLLLLSAFGISVQQRLALCLSRGGCLLGCLLAPADRLPQFLHDFLFVFLAQFRDRFVRALYEFGIWVPVLATGPVYAGRDRQAQGKLAAVASNAHGSGLSLLWIVVRIAGRLCYILSRPSG